MVLAYTTAAKPLANEVEDLAPFGVLTDVELRDQLPTGSGAFVPANRYVKRTSSSTKPAIYASSLSC
jgi:hypothetical protein